MTDSNTTEQNSCVHVHYYIHMSHFIDAEFTPH